MSDYYHTQFMESIRSETTQNHFSAWKMVHWDNKLQNFLFTSNEYILSNFFVGHKRGARAA